MEQMDSITKHFGIERYRSVAAVCAIYLDAQNMETHLYSKLTSFCVNNLTHISLYGCNFGLINSLDCNFRASSYNLNKCLVRIIILAENIRNPASIQSHATIGPPVKHHSNGVSLAGPQ